MRLPFEFSWLFVLALMGLASFAPRTNASWSVLIKALMWILAGLTALAILILKGLTGKGMDDYVGAFLFNQACGIVSISVNCPYEIRKRQKEQGAQTMRNIRQMTEMAKLAREVRSSHARPIFECGQRLLTANIERKLKQPFDAPIGIWFGNGEKGAKASWSVYNFPAGNTVVICAPADGSKPFTLDIPAEARLCGFSEQEFSCW